MSGNKLSDKLINVVTKLGKYKAIVLSLAVIVVFVTTYMLILPAFTLEKDEAEKQGGIDLPATATSALDETESGELSDADDADSTSASSAAQNAAGDPLKYEGKDFSITVSDNEEVLPEGTSINVEEIDRKENAEDYENYYNEALSAIKDADGNNTLKEFGFARFYDISLVSDGETVEPHNGDSVSVRIEYDDQLRKSLGVENKDNVRIIHFTEDMETGELVTEVLDSKESNVLIDTDSSDKLQSAEFDADSFSVYAVVYTVDFHWEVDGEEYVFNLEGGRAITLKELIKILNIADDAESFASDVESAEFSDPDLVWVGKVDEDTTVGALKDAAGLESEYSSELTEEQIAEIDAQAISSGEWVLISLKPFDTEEKLFVTMKNGETFEVRVTDVAYQGTKVTDPNGKTVALLNLSNNNALQSTAHSTAGRLQATEIQVNGNRITSFDPLSTWTFTKVPNTTDRYYIQASNGYLNISSNGAVSVSSQQQALTIQQKNDGTIRIKHPDNNYAINNNENLTANGYGGYSSTWDSNPGEWFTMYEIGEPIIPHVTVHYVKRDGTELTDVEYTGSNPLVVKNADGTFTIPYDWGSGQTSDTSIDLRSQFALEGYTYANTHLSGKDADGKTLTYDGYIIDSALTRSGSDLQFKSDSGATSAGMWNNPPQGNLQYGGLTSFSLSGNVSARPAINGDRITYATSGNKDIYVILDPLPTGSSGNWAGGVDPADTEAPSLEKTMESNEDGTYTLSLKVDAHATNAEDTNKANVLFIVDTSSSMRATTTDNRHNRIMDTHDAVLDLGQRLLAYNTNHPHSVEVSMITFDGGVEEPLDWTESTSEFQSVVNDKLVYKYLHTGTDWEDAMKGALEKLLDDTDDDPTFVIFFTDGEPSQYTSFHGTNTNSYSDPTGTYVGPNDPGEGYSDYFSYFLSREASKDEMRAIVDIGAVLYGIYAYNTTNQSYSGYNGPEDGAKMLHNAIKYGYNSSESLEGTYFYEARNTSALQGAFDKIFNLITEKVGFTNVVVNDGIAAGVTSTAVLNGDVSAFTYTIKDKDDNLVYKVTVAPNGVPDGQTVEAGTPLFWFGKDGDPHVGQKKTISTKKIKTDSSGNPVLDENEKIQTEDVDVEVYYYKDSDDKEYIMPISTTGENIAWDLSPLGILKDGYSYEVDFVVWPNQGSYDIVADLNNGKRPDIEETANWEAQPIKTDSEGNEYRQGGIPAYPYISRYEETGIYSAMSNTDQSVDYYKVDNKIVNGVEVTEYTGPTTVTVDPPDPMPLTSSMSAIEKQWNVERDPGILAQYLYNSDRTPKKFKIDFDIYQGTATKPYTTASLGWDPEANNGQGAYVWAEDSPMTSAEYAGQTYQIGTRWADDFSIATGLMLSTERMDALGLNKSLYDSATYNGTTYYILETGHDYTIKEHASGTIGYEFDFEQPTFHPMLVDGELQSVTFGKDGDNITITDITNEEGGLSSLLIENTLRGYIHLKKVVIDQNNERITNDKTKFKYNITLNSPTSPGPFDGDHIPWYAINGLFYHDEDFNYYQVYEDENKVWKIKLEDGTIYNVTSEGFDPDNADAQTVTYKISDTESGSVELFGNRTSTSNANKTATAELWINQDEILSIANVPVETTYTITETQNDGYTLTEILKQIVDNDNVESEETVQDLSGMSVSGTIVENRDNNITFTNKVKEGALKFTKIVKIDSSDPSPDQYDKVDGDYIFTVTNAEGNHFEITKYVMITVVNGVAASYRIADSAEGLSTAEPVEGSWAILSGLAQGDYVITETEERNGLLLSDLSRGDGDTGAVDADHGTVTVHVYEEDTTASHADSQASFTNSHVNNDGPDRIALDIVKVFEGLASASDIPDNFRVVISYTVPGSSAPIELELKKGQDETIVAGGENIKIKETTDGFKLSWHITNIPNGATNFRIKEANYGSFAGYTFIEATLDGEVITATAADWHDMTVTAPEAELTKVTNERETSDSPSNRKFKLMDGDILLTKLTANQGTLVISKTALNTLERAAVVEGWPQQGGFKMPPIYFSVEEHPDGFKYGGREISFSTDTDGNTIVSFTSNASSQEDVFAVTYDSQEALNNAALTNKYDQNPVTLEILKVDASDMTTPLEGAKFELNKLDPETEGNFITGDGAVHKESNVTGADGSAVISGLMDGYYEIEETARPEGYVIVEDGKFYIKITGGVITRIIKTEDDPETEGINEGLVINWPEASDNTGNVQYVGRQPAAVDNPDTGDIDEYSEAITTYKVGNVYAAELPLTGGIGTTVFYVLGALLILGCGIYLISRRRINE